MATAELVPPIYIDIPLALQSANCTPDELQSETFLADQIESLWRIRECHATAISKDRKGMRSVDANLGQMLYNLKVVLCRPGRAGKWSAWLAERHISRATADRLVLGFARSRHLTQESPHEQISEPTELEIGKLFAIVWQRCEAKLTTPRSRYDFIHIFVGRSGLAYEYQPGGIFVFDPAHTTQEKPEPAALPQEPPRGAAGLEYGDVL